MNRPQIARIVVIVVLGLTAGSEWARVFGWSQIGVRVALATLLPVAIAVALNWRTVRPVWVTVSVSVLVYLWFDVVVVLGDGIARVLPSGSGLSGTYDGIVNGWSQILSLPLPVTGSRGVFVFPCALGWLAAMVSTELCLRVRHVLIALVPMLMAFGAALFFGIGGPGSRVVPALVVAGTSLVFAGIRPDGGTRLETRQRTRTRSRRSVEAAVTMMLVLVLAAVIGPSAPGIKSSKPYDPRTSRQPPASVDDVLSPLEQLDGWQSEQPHALFTVRSAVPVTSTLAVLDQYSELEGWTGSSHFERIGTTVPSGSAAFAGFLPATVSPPAAPQEEVKQDVQYMMDAIAGPWLPLAGLASQVHGIQALDDPGTGTLISASGSAAGARYSTIALVPKGQPSCVGDDVVPSTEPPVSVAIRVEAENLAGGDVPPCEEAEALLTAFTSGRYKVDPKAPSGTGIDILDNFLYGKAPLGERGTSEQFAGAYALLAQALGLDVRVVVGFHAGTEIGRGLWKVTTTDAFAFDEINFVGLGWVGVDPTPTTSATSPPDEPLKSKATAGHASGPPLAAPQQYAPSHAPSSAARVAGLPVIIVVLIAIVLAVSVGAGCMAGAVVLVRRGKRRRRHLGGARSRIVGAWLEMTDSLHQRGVAVDATRTPEEIVASGRQVVPGEHQGTLEELAAMVNLALYGEAQPDEATIERAWRCAADVSVACRSSRDRRQKVRAIFDVRAAFER